MEDVKPVSRHGRYNPRNGTAWPLDHRSFVSNDFQYASRWWRPNLSTALIQARGKQWKSSKSFLVHSPTLVAFAERQVRNVSEFRGDDRRIGRRHLMVLPVVLQPLDDDLQPSGEMFAAVSRDISVTGIGLIHTVPVPRKRFNLRMNLASEDVNLLTEFVWCKALGPFYYIGGRFLAKQRG